ncbi:serpentine type 7TM GPCR chemoreceptor srw domain-containing protein [Ditylenchus destructor]|nr:serpentine type 7TM GPCR chemoreceptor srw domain-containing protein [Ditylenchus destructor]
MTDLYDVSVDEASTYELQPTQFPINCTVAAKLENLTGPVILGEWHSTLVNVEHCGICGSTASENDFTYTVYNLLVIGTLLPFISLCGFVGNGLSAFVYSRPAMRRTSINLYLCALGCSDIAVIFTAIFLFFFDSIRRYSIAISVIFGHSSPIIYPAGMIAQTCSVYFTLVAGIDCFIQVCIPNGPLKRCFSDKRCVRMSIATVLAFSLLYNAPHFFEAVLLDCWHVEFQSQSVEVCPAPFRFNPTYMTLYYKYMYSIFLAVGPLFVLIVLNTCIIAFTMLKSDNKEDGEGEEESDDNFALILVVLLFISCNTVALLINVFENKLSAWLAWRINYIIDMSNLLVVFNSSFNFVIYYNFSKSFRLTFLEYFCAKKNSFSAYSTSALLPSPMIVSINESGNGNSTKHQIVPHINSSSNSNSHKSTGKKHRVITVKPKPIPGKLPKPHSKATLHPVPKDDSSDVKSETNDVKTPLMSPANCAKSKTFGSNLPAGKLTNGNAIPSTSGVVETTAHLVCICFGVNSSEHCVENFDWLVTFAALGSVANDHAAFCPKAERQWEPYLNLKLSGLFIDYYSRNQHTDSERLGGVYKAHVSAIGKRDSEEEC